MGDGPGADEGDVRYSWVRGEVVRCSGPADQRLDEIRGVPASREGRAGNGSGVGEGPGRLFGAFDNKGGASEECGYYGREDVVDLGRINGGDCGEGRVGITG